MVIKIKAILRFIFCGIDTEDSDLRMTLVNNVKRRRQGFGTSKDYFQILKVCLFRLTVGNWRGPRSSARGTDNPHRRTLSNNALRFMGVLALNDDNVGAHLRTGVFRTGLRV